MAEPKIEQGGIVPSPAERDPKTGQFIFKRLRRIYTDAMAPDSVPDWNIFQRALDEAIKQTAGQDIDGIDMRPWSEKPNA